MFFKKEIAAENINKFLKFRLDANIGFAHSDMSYLGEYENAIDILFNFIVENDHNIDTVANPLLYLMRHSIELGLKHNINYLEKYSLHKTSSKVKGGHNLGALASEFQTHFQSLHIKYGFSEEILKQFSNLFSHAGIAIKELGEDDASFRYVRTRTGKRIFTHAEKKNILDIKQKYDETIILLSYTADVIAIHTDYEDLLSIAPEFKNGTGLVLFRFPSIQKNAMADHISERYTGLDTFLWEGIDLDTKMKLLEVNNECFLVPFKDSQ